MATADSVKAKLQGLLDAANAATGNSDATLAAAVNTLIDGYGKGGGDDSVLDSLIDRSITEISSNAETVGAKAFSECKSLITADFPRAKGTGGEGFYNCYALTTINFPTATVIQAYSFYGCRSLTSVNCPAAKNITANAFQGCTSLEKIELPAAIYIRTSAFDSCELLATADFSAVTNIASKAFNDCSSLSALILRKDSVCALSAIDAFAGTPIESGTGYVYVPSSLVDSYKAAASWSTYANQIRAIEDYPEITGASE